MLVLGLCNIILPWIFLKWEKLFLNKFENEKIGKNRTLVKSSSNLAIDKKIILHDDYTEYYLINFSEEY